MLTFSILGKPKGKGRPRFTRTGHAYTPATTKAYEAQIRQAFRSRYAGFVPLDCPMKLEIDVLYKPPRGAIKGPPRPEKPVRAPDVDNVAKAVMDALNGVVWADDKQVTTLEVRRHWGAWDGLQITINSD